MILSMCVCVCPQSLKAVQDRLKKEKCNGKYYPRGEKNKAEFSSVLHIAVRVGHTYPAWLFLGLFQSTGCTHIPVLYAWAQRSLGFLRFIVASCCMYGAKGCSGPPVQLACGRQTIPQLWMRCWQLALMSQQLTNMMPHPSTGCPWHQTARRMPLPLQVPPLCCSWP